MSALRSQVGARAGWGTTCSIPCPGCVTQKRSACHEISTLCPRDAGRAGLVCPIYLLTLASPRTSLRFVTCRFHYKTQSFDYIHQMFIVKHTVLNIFPIADHMFAYNTLQNKAVWR